MSRRGDCWDNAIAAYIEGFYNPRRRHSSLGYVSPVVFEVQHATAARLLHDHGVHGIGAGSNKRSEQ